MKITWVSVDRELFYELATKYQFEFCDEGLANMPPCRDVMDNHGNYLRRSVNYSDNKTCFKYYKGVEIMDIDYIEITRKTMVNCFHHHIQQE